MNTVLCKETPQPDTRGRKAGFDYSIFDTDTVVKVTDKDSRKVYSRINAIRAQAKRYGYSVRTYTCVKNKQYIGCIVRK